MVVYHFADTYTAMMLTKEWRRSYTNIILISIIRLSLKWLQIESHTHTKFHIRNHRTHLMFVRCGLLMCWICALVHSTGMHSSRWSANSIANALLENQNRRSFVYIGFYFSQWKHNSRCMQKVYLAKRSKADQCRAIANGKHSRIYQTCMSVQR